MPSSTMHLLVAQAVAQASSIPLTGRFLLGNLAPDAIAMRPGYTAEDQAHAHLRNPDWKAAWSQAGELIAMYPKDPFVLGACVHILTDYLWLAEPYRYFKEHIPADMPERDARVRYYTDVEALDRYLFRQTGSHNLWTAAMAAQPQDFADLVTAGEVDHWRKDRFAQLQQTKTMDPAQILTVSLAQNFIDTTAQRLGRELDKILMAQGG